jgi:hypothetical protein
MITNNHIEKSFGPAGTAAGVFIFVIGLIATYNSFFGLILIVLGAFIGFTTGSALIDFDQRRVKFSNNIFGIIRTGKWIHIEPGMQLGIKKNDEVWRTFSRSNRELDVAQDDFRIILYNAEHKEIMPLMKMGSLAAANESLGVLKIDLVLETI